MAKQLHFTYDGKDYTLEFTLNSCGNGEEGLYRF